MMALRDLVPQYRVITLPRLPGRASGQALTVRVANILCPVPLTHLIPTPPTAQPVPPLPSVHSWRNGSTERFGILSKVTQLVKRARLRTQLVLESLLSTLPLSHYKTPQSASPMQTGTRPVSPTPEPQPWKTAFPIGGTPSPSPHCDAGGRRLLNMCWVYKGGSEKTDPSEISQGVVWPEPLPKAN